MAIASPKKTRIGSIVVVAKILVTTKYLKGFVPETSIASICSVTRMEPNSAPIPEPVLKSKQPLPFEEAAPAAGAVVEADADLGADLDLDVDDAAEPSPDDDVDLGGDDDLGVNTSDANDEN